MKACEEGIFLKFNQIVSKKSFLVLGIDMNFLSLGWKPEFSDYGGTRGLLYSLQMVCQFLR